jgi:hypothetical protein
MRISPRLGFRIVLVVIALCLLWLRLVPRLLQRSRPRAANDLSVTAPLNQPGGGPAPAEAYAIYSALYQAPMNEPLVFASDSQTDEPQVGASCLKPSTPDERELAGAFDAANQKSHEWEPRFAIPQGYRVLNPSELAEARACQSPDAHNAAQCSAWKSVRHIRYLGVPGIDPSDTHALVSVIKSCGSQCGGGGIFEVEKSGNTWQRSPASDFTRDCSWVY